MENIREYKWHFVITIIVVILWQVSSNNQTTTLISSEETSEIVSENKGPSGTIYVQINGVVNKPGLYQMHAGDRINDLLEEAEVKEYNGSCVNLAQKLVDEQNIYIPSSNEECKDEQSIQNGVVNINQASVYELQTISGIGEAKATAIVEYRENNGTFQTKEALLEVEGISEGLLLSISEQISLS